MLQSFEQPHMCLQGNSVTAFIGSITDCQVCTHIQSDSVSLVLSDQAWSVFMLITHCSECPQWHCTCDVSCCVKVKTCFGKKKSITSYQKAFLRSSKSGEGDLDTFCLFFKSCKCRGRLDIICSESKVLWSASGQKMGCRESSILRPVYFWFRYVVFGGFSDPNGFPVSFLVWRCKPDQVKRICNWRNFNKAVTLP